MKVVNFFEISYYFEEKTCFILGVRSTNGDLFGYSKHMSAGLAGSGVVSSCA